METMNAAMMSDPLALNNDSNNNNNVDQLITDIDEESSTPIQQFYANCNIFVTGGTGFLGKSK